MVPENGLHRGCLNPGPLGHESSALTTRPRLFALNKLHFLGFLLLEFGQGRLTSLQFIQYHVLFLKVHPPICRITAYATMPG